MAVVVTKSGVVHDRMMRVENDLSQTDLDTAARYINENFSGWTIESLRAELARRIDQERSEYDRLMNSLEQLCKGGALAGDEAAKSIFVEGVANLVRSALKESLKATITRQVGAWVSRSAFEDFKKRLDHTEYGGAPLLGVKGVCIITHGSSNANAMKNAIRVAAEFGESGINQAIEHGLAALHQTFVSST